MSNFWGAVHNLRLFLFKICCNSKSQKCKNTSLDNFGKEKINVSVPESFLKGLTLTQENSNKKTKGNSFVSVAERQGFEPWVRISGQRFSRPPHSTALASLL